MDGREVMRELLGCMWITGCRALGSLDGRLAVRVGVSTDFLQQALQKLKVEKDSWVVDGLTGFLVLADNVAANAFRRVSDEGFTPLYISIWMRELRDRLDRCSTCLTCLQGTVTDHEP